MSGQYTTIPSQNKAQEHQKITRFEPLHVSKSTVEQAKQTSPKTFLTEVSDEGITTVRSADEESVGKATNTSVERALALLMICSIFMAIALWCYIQRQRNRHMKSITKN